MANPIWKDFYVNLGDAESAEFRIVADNTAIYIGKSYKKPGQTENQIRINDICADYIGKTMPNETEILVADKMPKFRVQKKDGNWTLVKTVEFYCDWSYNPSETGLFARPINGHITIDTPIMISNYTTGNKINLYYQTKGQNPQSLSVEIETLSNVVANHFISLPDILQPSVLEKLSWVSIGTSKYTIVPQCHRYALYYTNANGGWDVFLIEGNHSETDNLTRHTREVEYDNRVVSNRGTMNYANEIAKSLTLHTSWLSDEESSRMHHLLNSTNVYLRDNVDGIMIPVVLTDTTTEYKTYKGNGGKLVNYSINVTIAQERIRR